MSRKIEFRPPDGSVPEGITEGEDFDLLCNFIVKGNGDVCLAKMGDVEMPGYRGSDTTPKRPRQAMQEMMEEDNG